MDQETIALISSVGVPLLLFALAYWRDRGIKAKTEEVNGGLDGLREEVSQLRRDLRACEKERTRLVRREIDLMRQLTREED